MSDIDLPPLDAERLEALAMTIARVLVEIARREINVHPSGHNNHEVAQSAA